MHIVYIRDVAITEIRTDLALEAQELNKESSNKSEIFTESETVNGIKITRQKVISKRDELSLGKSKGTYITIEMNSIDDDITNADDKIYAISDEISNLLPEDGCVLVAGIGNENITADALGPKTIEGILATRHITHEIAAQIGLDNLRSVAAIAPGVLGQTGVETSELILSIIKKINPTALIAVDALASRKLSRLGSTIQISDAGIAPGTGVGNHRTPISKETMGIPVISIGVPTVVDAVTLAADIIEPFDKTSASRINDIISPKASHMVVTPKDIDLLISRCSRLVSLAINCALQRDLTREELITLTVNS